MVGNIQPFQTEVGIYGNKETVEPSSRLLDAEITHVPELTYCLS